MNRRLHCYYVFVLCALALASCSGAPGGGCVANCGGGHATVSFVLTATPPPPSAQFSIQAFTATITGFTLTPSSGTAVSVPLNSSAYNAEFTRVTSDSTVLAKNVSVAAGTYTSAQITFSLPRVSYCTQANSGVPGCAAGSLASVTGASGSATITTNISLADAQQTGIALNLDLGASLVATGQTITAVNLGASNAFDAKALPPTSTQTDLTTGQLSHVDDVQGIITAAASPTLTIHTSTRGDITAVANSSTQYSSDCTALSLTQDFGCVTLNSVAIVDTILNSDGTFTLTFYQPLLPTSTDIIEGVVTSVPNSVTNQFTVVVTDSVLAGSGSILSGQINLGDQVTVTLGSTPSAFVVIAKDLTLPAGETFSGSTSVTSIQPGQTIAILPSAFTAQSGATPGTAATSNVALRFTRVTGTMGTATVPIFTAANLPPLFGLATAQQFQTTPGRLSLDGVADITSISSGNTFSATALYFGPPTTPAFASQAVRAH
jgi:hypothetical protein